MNKPANLAVTIFVYFEDFLFFFNSSLRHYATSRKVAGSSPDEVDNPFSRTMALGSTEPLTEMSTRKIPGGGGGARPARKTDNLTANCEPIVQKMWEPRRLTTLWAFTACYRDSFTFFYLDASTQSHYSI
jgi:hypothetical protein